MEKDSNETMEHLLNSELQLHEINASETDAEHNHEGHTKLEDIVLPVLNEDQVDIARELINKKYPLRKMPIEDVITCCCCVRYWRKRRDLGDVKLTE
jgi:hypothetical protein